MRFPVVALLCLVSLCFGFALAAVSLWVALPVSVALGIVGVLVTIGRIGASWPGRVLSGLTIMATAGLMGLVSIGVGMAAHQRATAAAESERQEAELAQQRMNQRQQRDEALRQEAPQVLSVLQRDVEAAAVLLENRRYSDAAETITPAIEKLKPIAALSPPVDGAASLLTRATEIYETALPFSAAEQAIESARDAVHGRHDDANAAETAYKSALEALGEIAGDALTANKASVSRLTRQLEQKISRNADAAVRARFENRVANEGLVRVSAPELYSAFHTNEVMAEQRFMGKALALDGTVIRVETRLIGGPIVRLRGPNRANPVLAYLKDRGGAARLRPGQRATFKCEGAPKVLGFVSANDCSLMVTWN